VSTKKVANKIFLKLTSPHPIGGLGRGVGGLQLARSFLSGPTTTSLGLNWRGEFSQSNRSSQMLIWPASEPPLQRFSIKALSETGVTFVSPFQRKPSALLLQSILTSMRHDLVGLPRSFVHYCPPPSSAILNAVRGSDFLLPSSPLRSFAAPSPRRPAHAVGAGGSIGTRAPFYKKEVPKGSIPATKYMPSNYFSPSNSGFYSHHCVSTGTMCERSESVSSFGPATRSLPHGIE